MGMSILHNADFKIIIQLSTQCARKFARWIKEDKDNDAIPAFCKMLYFQAQVIIRNNKPLNRASSHIVIHLVKGSVSSYKLCTYYA